MRTCSALMRTDRPGYDLSGTRLRQPAAVVFRPGGTRGGAFTLVELLVVMSLLSLLVLLAQVSLSGVLRRNTIEAQVQDFVSLMQMAASNAAETGRKYEMIVNLAAQSYLLRKLTSSDLEARPLEEEIIAQGVFRGDCRVAYVEFDDGKPTYEDKAKFRVGHAGWQYGGKIVFRDESERENELVYSVIVHRITPIVQLIPGNPPLMTPKAKEEVPFL
jgi:prepilin-type N-terminal cleavage/methylation domain-containing protein